MNFDVSINGFADSVESIINGYDFSDKLETAINDYDFSELDIDSQIESYIDGEDFQKRDDLYYDVEAIVDDKGFIYESDLEDQVDQVIARRDLISKEDALSHHDLEPLNKRIEDLKTELAEATVFAHAAYEMMMAKTWRVRLQRLQNFSKAQWTRVSSFTRGLISRSA